MKTYTSHWQTRSGSFSGSYWNPYICKTHVKGFYGSLPRELRFHLEIHRNGEWEVDSEMLLAYSDADIEGIDLNEDFGRVLMRETKGERFDFYFEGRNE